MLGSYSIDNYLAFLGAREACILATQTLTFLMWEWIPAACILQYLALCRCGTTRLDNSIIARVILSNESWRQFRINIECKSGNHETISIYSISDFKSNA